MRKKQNTPLRRTTARYLAKRLAIGDDAVRSPGSKIKRLATKLQRTYSDGADSGGGAAGGSCWMKFAKGKMRGVGSMQ